MILSRSAITHPTPGTTRIHKRFAWWPRRVAGCVIWFEGYEILEVYLIEKCSLLLDGKWEDVAIGGWKVVSARFKKMTNE